MKKVIHYFKGGAISVNEGSQNIKMGGLPPEFSVEFSMDDEKFREWLLNIGEHEGKFREIVKKARKENEILNVDNDNIKIDKIKGRALASDLPKQKKDREKERFYPLK